MCVECSKAKALAALKGTAEVEVADADAEVAAEVATEVSLSEEE